MENAADALKIAFAVLVFVIAVTILFTMISKAKTTSDAVLYYADKTNFRPYTDSKDTVTVADIVATLYKYNNESVAVTIILDSNQIFNFDSGYESKNGNLLPNLNTLDDKEKNLGEFITDTLNSYSDKYFTEEFTEVLTPAGGKKIYITYKATSETI